MVFAQHTTPSEAAFHATKDNPESARKHALNMAQASPAIQSAEQSATLTKQLRSPRGQRDRLTAAREELVGDAGGELAEACTDGGADDAECENEFFRIGSFSLGRPQLVVCHAELADLPQLRRSTSDQFENVDCVVVDDVKPGLWLVFQGDDEAIIAVHAEVLEGKEYPTDLSWVIAGEVSGDFETLALVEPPRPRQERERTDQSTAGKDTTDALAGEEMHRWFDTWIDNVNYHLQDAEETVCVTGEVPGPIGVCWKAASSAAPTLSGGTSSEFGSGFEVFVAFDSSEQRRVTGVQVAPIIPSY